MAHKGECSQYPHYTFDGTTRKAEIECPAVHGRELVSKLHPRILPANEAPVIFFDEMQTETCPDSSTPPSPQRQIQPPIWRFLIEDPTPLWSWPTRAWHSIMFAPSYRRWRGRRNRAGKRFVWLSRQVKHLSCPFSVSPWLDKRAGFWRLDRCLETVIQTIPNLVADVI